MQGEILALLTSYDFFRHVTSPNLEKVLETCVIVGGGGLQIITARRRFKPIENEERCRT